MPTMPTIPAHPSRRTFLRVAALGIGSAGIATLAACTPQRPDSARTTESNIMIPTSATPSGKVLLAYFSRAGENYFNGGRRNLATGNTEVLAGLISERISCDVFRIEAADPYSNSYDDTVARNVREQDADARPGIAGTLPDLSGYDTVILGSPIWNVRPPMVVSTFLEGVDVAGKTLFPVVTYAVSGLGNAPDVYKDLARDADIKRGLAIRGEDINNASAGRDVDSWLRQVDLR